MVKLQPGTVYRPARSNDFAYSYSEAKALMTFADTNEDNKVSVKEAQAARDVIKAFRLDNAKDLSTAETDMLKDIENLFSVSAEYMYSLDDNEDGAVGYALDKNNKSDLTTAMNANLVFPYFFEDKDASQAILAFGDGNDDGKLSVKEAKDAEAAIKTFRTKNAEDLSKDDNTLLGLIGMMFQSAWVFMSRLDKNDDDMFQYKNTGKEKGDTEFDTAFNSVERIRPDKLDWTDFFYQGDDPPAAFKKGND